MADHDFYISEVHKKRKRRRFYLVLFLAALFICLVVLALSWLILRSPIFRIQNITIDGAKNVPAGDIFDLLRARIFAGKSWKALLGFGNILIWPDKLSGDDLVFLPTLKGLEIEKNYRERSIVVKVEERVAYGIWCFLETRTDAYKSSFQHEFAPSPRESASCWWFDDGGVIFKRAIGAQGNLILAVNDYSQNGLGLNSKILPEEFIGNLLSILKVLQAIDLSVKEIRLNNLSLQELEVLTYDGPKLYFSLRSPATNDLAVIQNFTAKPGFNKLQYLDFRVENRVYYK